MKKIVAVVGTNSKVSTNRYLLNNIKDLIKNKAQVEIVEIAGLPYKDTSMTNEDVDKIKKTIQEADGLIMTTVEYLHSPSAALINFLDWMVGKPSCMTNKPLFLCSANHGRTGSIKALSTLKQILESNQLSPLVYQKYFILNNSLNAFDDNHQLIDQDLIADLSSLMDAFLSFIDIFK